MEANDGSNEWDAIMSAHEKEDEIRRMTIAEDLSELDRALLQLEGGHSLQQMHAIARLPEVARLSGREGLELVMPAVLDSLLTLGADAQVATAGALLEIVQKGLISAHDMVDFVAPLALALACQPAADQVLDCWARLAVATVHHMDPAAIKRSILPFAMARATDRDMGVQGRLLCAAMLGAAAVKLPKEAVELECLPKALSLCQDIERTVRRCMLDQLPLLARGLGREATCSKLLSEIMDLAGDEESIVCCSALAALSSIAPLLTTDLRRGQVYPYVRSLCAGGQADSRVQRCLPKLFGKSLCKVAAELDGDADMALLLTAFKDLTSALHPHCRLACAEALPAVLKHATSRRYATYLHAPLAALAADKDAEVRCQLASCFGMLPQLLGRERCLQHLKRPFLLLLGDPEASVRRALLHNLAAFMEGIAGKSARDDAKLGAELAGHMVSLEASLGLDWRAQQSLLLTMPALSQVFSSDTCYDVLLPMALRQFSAGPAVLRAPAADAIIALMRAVQKPYQRTEILCRLLREYARGRSCYRRLAFLDAAAAVLHRYSVRFYKSHIMGCVGDLAADVTISVRMKAAHVLCVTAQHARALGDTDMSLRTEGLRREAFSTTLQPDPSMSTSARPEEGSSNADARNPDNSTSVATARSRDLQLEAEEVDAPFIAEELDRLHREQLLEKRRGVMAAKRSRAAAGPASAVAADAPRATSAGNTLGRNVADAAGSDSLSPTRSVLQTNSLQAAPLTISTSDAADTKGSKFLTGSIKAKGSDSARLAARLAKLSSEANTQLAQLREPQNAPPLNATAATPATKRGNKGAVAVSAYGNSQKS